MDRDYKLAPEFLGVASKTMSQRLDVGAESRIRFALGECSLGVILVAASDRGLCFIALGDDADALTGQLIEPFPKAVPADGDLEFGRTLAKVIGFVETPAVPLDLPLDIRGTAFQQRVWCAVQDIPPGTSASYSEIARRLGSPESARAVAGACAANELAVAIPCHRVVRSDGGLSGYRWGVERKAELLRREGIT